MEMPVHSLSELFRQLGLPDDPESIEAFIAQHRPLPPEIKLWEAPFWTPAQAEFLKRETEEDADWAELIDDLNTRLH